MRVLIGLDDTDAPDSRGTGFQARQLGERLQREGLAEVGGITRHQLLVSPQIPYTSHNSSACLSAVLHPADRELVIAYCREFLHAESAPAADAGLCVAVWEDLGAAVADFGARAKREVLTVEAALALGQERGLCLEGLTGTGQGVIGALAGVGLCWAGNDGRYLWVRGLRELSGTYTVAALQRAAGVEVVCDQQGHPVPLAAQVDVGPWPRPILSDGKAVLLVEEVDHHDRSHWRVLAKDTIKALTE